MQKIRDLVVLWGPSLAMMAAIFALSAQAGTAFPNFGSWDYAIKKAGHMLGYALLAIAYWRGVRWNHGREWQAWLLAMLYACTDEFHQSVVPGRHPSWLDVGLFDASGAAIGLWLRRA